MLKKLLLATIFVLLAVIGCTTLALKYNWDITQNNANTLIDSSKLILDTLQSPLEITVYSPDVNILNTCSVVLDMFKKYSPKVQVSLQKDMLDASIAAKLKLFSEHNIVVKYNSVQRGLDIKLSDLSQYQISALIQQTINQASNWLVFLTGHQELDPNDTSENGISSFASLFTEQGIHVTTLNLAEHQLIPQNTSVLIVANPQTDLLPVEKSLLHQYLANGGKLIWFTEPSATITAFLMEEFGLKPSKGVVLDMSSLQLGSPHPAIKILTQYPSHAITEDVQASTIFPWSAHIQELYQANDWQLDPFIVSDTDTWTYNGPSTQDAKLFHKYKEFDGPLNIGVALHRTLPNNVEQRASVIADSSFILNKYLTMYANRQIVINTVGWVENDTKVALYNPPPLRDLSYNPSKLDRFMFTYFFTMLLPMLFISIGFLQSRRKTG